MIFENSLPKANFGQNIRDSPNGSLTADSRSLQTATLNFLSFKVFSLNPSFRKFSRTGDYLFKFIWTKEHLLQKNWPGTTCLLFHVKEHLCGWCEFANINLYLMAYSFFMFFFIWILIGHWRVTILMPHFFLQTTATGGVLHFSNFLNPYRLPRSLCKPTHIWELNKLITYIKGWFLFSFLPCLCGSFYEVVFLNMFDEKVCQYQLSWDRSWKFINDFYGFHINVNSITGRLLDLNKVRVKIPLSSAILLSNNKSQPKTLHWQLQRLQI